MAAPSYAPDYYERLGIDPVSDSHLIRRHYRLLARLYHPDVNPSPDANERFLKLREAHDILGDPQRRNEYDRWLEQDARIWQPLLVKQQQFPSTLVRSYGRQRAYLLVDLGVKGKTSGLTTPLNLVVVLDRSSSMKGRRLHYVKEAARQIVSNLTPHDYFGIVTFNDHGSVILPAGPAIDTMVATSAIDSISPAGGTEMANGIRLGLNEVRRYQGPRVISHMIVLTDGRTYGDEAEVLQLAALAGDEGIGITAMGLGNDWNDELLDEMARRGSGSAHYIAEPDQAVELFQSQIQRLQHTSAREAFLAIEPGPGVEFLRAHEVAPGLRGLKLEEGLLRLGPLPAAPPLRLLAEYAVNLPPRDVVLLSNLTLQAEMLQDSRSYTTRRTIISDIGDEPVEPPPDIYQGARRVAMLQLQEQTWHAVEQGQGTRAISSLEQLADRFMEIGAMELAIATQREVEVVQQTGHLSAGGRKIIKYGTRMLALPAPLEEE